MFGAVLLSSEWPGRLFFCRASDKGRQKCSQNVDEGLLSLYLNARRHCPLAAAERTVKAHTFTIDAYNLCVIGIFAISIIGRLDH